MFFVFGVLVLVTISNIPHALSEDFEFRGAKIKYGGIRFIPMYGTGECQGILVTKEWIVADANCPTENVRNLHVTKIGGKPVSIDVDIEEVHVSSNHVDPQMHYYKMIKTSKRITQREFNYLPVKGSPTWKNVKTAAEGFCQNSHIKGMINKVISKETGVSEKICNQSFGDDNLVPRWY